MNTQQLIEMAVLDALVLLDDEERDDFERSFRGASPQVQAHVRREQTRLCSIETILPDVQPPAGLRAAVLAAVRDEIAHAEESRSYAARPLAIFPATRVSPLWRAAAVGLGTAAVVLGGTTLWVNLEIDKIEERIDSFDASVTIDNQYGLEYVAAFGDPEVVKVGFKPVDPAFEGQASLHIDHERGKIFVVCPQLPVQEGRSYTLVLVTPDGAETELDSFTSDGSAKTFASVTLGADDALVIMASNAMGQREAVLRTPDGAFSQL